MSTQQKIKEAVVRSTKALRLRPSLGIGTGLSKTTISKGLSCIITEGNYTFKADMPESIGGAATGPTPGVYGRAALGSCLAMGYMLKAAAMDIHIESLEVEVQADYDDGSLFGTSDSPPGYLEIRYTVSIQSNAKEHEIIHMLNEADAHSPYLDVFSRAQKIKRIDNIISTKTRS